MSVILGVYEYTEELRVAKGTDTLPSYIPTEATLLENDNVETSGIGGIYPKGIHIGTIKQIVNTKNNIDRYAYVETAVDFSKLQTVLVITNE